MFMYEAEGKLNIVFDENRPVENPDVIIEKGEDGYIRIHIGDTVISNEPQG